MKRPDLDKVRASARAEFGADPEPPKGLFDDEPPVDSYEIPPVASRVIPIRPNMASGNSFDPDANTVNMKTAIEDAYKYAQARVRRKQTGKLLEGSPSGFTDIDKIIDGWQRKCVYYIGGRTGMGKSIVALNVALGIVRLGESAAYLSLEMITREHTMRALFAESRVDSWRWKNGTMRPEHWSAMTRAAGAMSKYPWLFDDTSTMTIEQIRTKLETIKTTCKAEFGKDLHTAVLDHLLLIAGSNDRQPRREQLVQITKNLKVIAKDLDLCLIVPTQLSRAMEARSVKDKRPQISDLKETGSIEEDADGILLLYRADYYRKNKKDWDNELEVSVAKVRGGEPGFVKMRFNGPQQRIDNLDSDDVSLAVQEGDDDDDS